MSITWLRTELNYDWMHFICWFTLHFSNKVCQDIKCCVCLKNHFHAVTPIVRTVWKRPLGSKTEWVNIVKLCTNITHRTKTCFLQPVNHGGYVRAIQRTEYCWFSWTVKRIINLYTDSSFPLWSIPETKGWHVMAAAWSFPISFCLVTGTETQQYIFYCHVSKHKWQSRLTFSFTDLTSFLTFASQKAPLYFALTSVPISKKAGSNVAWNIYRLRIVQW